MQRLPTDILLHLTSTYFWDDQTTLRTTSLLCRDTQFLSQRLLFHSIIIAATGDGNCVFVRRLGSMAQAPARIISYIKAFGLTNKMRRRRPEERRAWAQNHVGLLNIGLRRLVLAGAIEALSINAFLSTGHEAGITDDPETISLLKQLCCLPSVDTLALTGAPGELLQQPFSSNLRHLIARNVQALPAPQPGLNQSALAPPMNHRRATLQSLGYYPHVSEYTPTLQSVIDFLLGSSNSYLDLEGVKFITAYCITDLHYAQVAKLLDHCGLSLEALDLKFAFLPMAEIQLGIQKLTGLRRICFTIRVEATAMCEWICRQLKPASTGPASINPQDTISSLESITVVVVPPVWKVVYDRQDCHWMSLLVEQLNKLKRDGTPPKFRFMEICCWHFDEAVSSARDLLRRGVGSRNVTSPEGWDAAIRDITRPLEESGVTVTTSWAMGQKSTWYTSAVF
ncbi:hypothetical protein BKA70DRAFT_554670 [Coprinopsis sp. MPI-PUGE-AT-0042]|nr:hypothetical protein BKA70DRAFT_554670 [Coprinopsis sp. MPI-PUGE-AT-0042]